ncbi:MAG: lecithin retinol acyltransferase family protein, partial [Planctomycetota bacterium]
QSMARGEHIYVQSSLNGLPFQHHGIDMGDGSVIHLAPASGARVTISDTSGEFTVRRDSLDDFCRGEQPIVFEHVDARDAELICQEAEARLGESGYHLLENNCEHFATDCATGRHESHQIEMGEATLSAITSMGTKAFWAISSRYGGRLLAKGMTRVHPASLLADGVEIATLAATCRSGMGSQNSRRIAKFSGTATAAGIGTVLGGPGGAAACIALHVGSGAVAERVCTTVRRWIG